MKPNGLVLIGGKSQRMGEDKSKLVYHNQSTQLDYVYHLLNQFCNKTFLSVGFNQKNEKFPYETIVDEEEDKGPITGILSAFAFNKNVAWLVCPIDMPFVTDEVISYLLKNRNLQKDCTCFYNEETQAADPLLGIYESSIFPIIQKAQKEGVFSPKKCVSLSNHNLILLKSNEWLFNANTPEQVNEAKAKF